MTRDRPAIRQPIPIADDPVFRKSVSNPFVATSLEAHLRAHQVSRVVVAGLTTQHCVSSTCRSASDLGFADTPS